MGDEGADGLLAEREPPFALGAAAQDAELLLDDGRVVASLDDAAAALGGGGVAGAVVGVPTTLISARSRSGCRRARCQPMPAPCETPV